MPHTFSRVCRQLCVPLRLAGRSSPLGGPASGRWSSTITAARAAEALAARWAGRTQTLTERIEATQLLHLRQLTGELVPLASSAHLHPQARALDGDTTPLHGSPILPGEHLSYFLPRQATSQLGSDGSDTTFSPVGFPRRRWAGGQMQFHQPLCVGEIVEETTWVERVEPKQIRSGEMILLSLRKELRSPKGVAVSESRSWVFLPALAETEAALSGGHKVHSLPAGLAMELSLPHLFRYSALTYNAHRIHYDAGWCRKVEGVRAPVVHGPLNISLLLRLALRSGPVAGVTYRATQPVCVGERYVLAQEGDELRASDGKDIMRATIARA